MLLRLMQKLNLIETYLAVVHRLVVNLSSNVPRTELELALTLPLLWLFQTCTIHPFDIYVANGKLEALPLAS